ncbi:hypothetical protein OG991_47385 [Streptomyces mirabilis]|nr:hypothetical protein [Streptomyces mirabilis]MCX4427024.1 hypothetical protein [Streptomyces mirabilis]
MSALAAGRSAPQAGQSSIHTPAPTALDDGHETSMEEPHWGHNSDGQPIAWVGSAPDVW